MPLQNSTLRCCLQVLNAPAIVLGPCFFFIKTSILLLYHRLFSVGSSLLLRRLIWFGIAFHMLFYGAFTALVLALYGPCGTLAGSASKRICTDVDEATVMQGALNVATDIYVLLLPLLVLWRLHMPLTRKLGACSVFFTGSM
jgi:hypothetical protein